MHRFTQLYMALDQTNRTSEKLKAMRAYFRMAPAADAAWALYFLSGSKVRRVVNSPILRVWISEYTGYPLWLVEECYDAVGDLAETMALLLPRQSTSFTMPLHRLVESRLLPMAALAEEDKKTVMLRCWEEMSRDEVFVWHKLVLGSFRVGVSRTLVVRAMAEVAGVEPAIMAHRLMGNWSPTVQDYERLLDGCALDADPAKPYPFYLAYPVDGEPDALGPVDEFQLEWKWDGIRSQLIHRCGQVMVWSRGEDLITDRFPEIAEVGKFLPQGTVLDGEILAWRDGRPAPFQELQQRITRKNVTPAILKKIPVAFIAYDMMEWEGEDIRHLPMAERRALLEKLAATMPSTPTFQLSYVHELESWAEAAALRAQSRAHDAEGLMIKRLDSPYRVGRIRGDWWKWKIEPYTIDAVLTYAQRGHGRRASLYTDYTFGIWQGEELITIAKAYSGLTDKEIAEVDAWVRKNTVDRFGPVRQVKPELVFELGFEGIQHNPRNKSKLAVRFPRILRWRKDKPMEEADTIDTMRALLD